jgi:glutamate synthase domain-containing protein 1
MCGIAGIFYKGKPLKSRPPVGAQLVRMMESMRHRGADSTGFTVAGEPVAKDELILRLCSPGTHDSNALAAAIAALKKLGCQIRSRQQTGGHLRLVVRTRRNLQTISDALLAVPGLEVHSLGHASEIIKDVGDARELDAKHHVSKLHGTHGLGHNRLATESQVDIGHSHPFWAYPFSDVTTVHNGQLTNYHKLRRVFEEQGYRFQTHNDSELIAVYLADKLAHGASLQAALENSVRDFDGTFTYLVSTAQGIGFAKDKLVLKPLVVMERDNLVALASEEVALCQIFPEDIERIEPQQSQVRVWLN